MTVKDHGHCQCILGNKFKNLFSQGKDLYYYYEVVKKPYDKFTTVHSKFEFSLEWYI